MYALKMQIDERYINAVIKWGGRDSLRSVFKSLGMIGVYTRLKKLTPFVPKYFQGI